MDNLAAKILFTDDLSAEDFEQKFEKVTFNNTGILPTRADDRSAGYDFYSPEDVVIEPNEMKIIPTFIKCKLLPNTYLSIHVRSSIGIKKHLMLANTTGIIDSSYYNNPDNEGNIMIALYNYGTEAQTIKVGDRIAQGIISNYLLVNNDNVLNAGRTGGIGSSGV